jgi:nucleoside-diphosphate-sugar epimerase
VVNLGNPVETTVKDVAFECWRTVRPGDAYKVNTTVGHPDDPKRRCPDITRARELLDWAPQVTLEQGLRQTAAWLFGDDRGRSKTGGDPEAGERLGEGVQASGSQDGARSTG